MPRRPRAISPAVLPRAVTPAVLPRAVTPAVLPRAVTPAVLPRQWENQREQPPPPARTLGRDE